MVKRHPLHSMCSYLGCFPPSVPHRIIEEWVPEGAHILDPFCGAGTTLIEGSLLGHSCLGIDLNPLAVALSLAKVQPITLPDVLDRISDLARSYPGVVDTENVPEELRIIFHPRTLGQLTYLKDILNPIHPEDLFLRGAVLGIMHGKFRKSGDTAYLSIDMPNTFSMSPEYVMRFVKQHNLRQPAVDVFSKLRERCAWLLREGALRPKPEIQVLHGDATQLPTILRRENIGHIDAVVTSPPYLGVLRYGAFNWIRLWFLGFEPSPIDKSLDATDSLDRYLSFLTSFLLSTARVVKPGAPVILVIGDVEESGRRLHLAERVWEELSGIVPFDLLAIDIDKFDETTKTTRIWGEDRKGRATPLDRVLILERVPASEEETQRPPKTARAPLRP